MEITTDIGTAKPTSEDIIHASIVIRPSDVVWFSYDMVPPVIFGEGTPFDSWRRFRSLNVVIPDLSREYVTIENTELFIGLKAVFLEGASWEETDFYQRILDHVREGFVLWGCKTKADVDRRFNHIIPQLYRSIAKNGLLPQNEIISDGTSYPHLLPFENGTYYDDNDELNDIKMCIDQAGKLILLEGQHRFCIARLLNLDIPVVVSLRAESWDKIRRGVSALARPGGLIKIDHPDLAGLAMPATEEAKALALSVPGFTLRESEIPPVTYLRREDYLSICRTIGGGHWHNAEMRWSYHGASVAIAQIVSPRSPDHVLEMGTMGVNIVPGSNTIDYAEGWSFEGKSPTYPHDGRKTPWPIKSDAYDLFIALRVFHHLAPSQREAFREARRIARNIIIVAPERYDKVPGSAGIPIEDFIAWNDGVPPTAVLEFGEDFGNLYFWSEKALHGT